MTLNDMIYVASIYSKDMTDYYYLWNDIDIDNRLDKTVLIDNILLKCSNAVCVTNTVADFVHLSNGFFKKWKYQISCLLNTQEFKYNPIWNRDGTIKEVRTIERAREENIGEDIDTKADSTLTEGRENKVSAFNASDYQPDSTSTTNSTRNDSENVNRDRDTNENETTAENFVQTNQGNVGVTTTQSMIQEERALYDFNIYEWITTRYRDELFLRVY